VRSLARGRTVADRKAGVGAGEEREWLGRRKCLSGCSTTSANWLFLVPHLSDVELDAVMRNHEIEQWVHRQPTDLRVEGCNSEWAGERQKVVQGERALRTERSRAR